VTTCLVGKPPEVVRQIGLDWVIGPFAVTEAFTTPGWRRSIRLGPGFQPGEAPGLRHPGGHYALINPLAAGPSGRHPPGRANRAPSTAWAGTHPRGGPAMRRGVTNGKGGAYLVLW
jgi:hypothetical protein